MRSNFDFNLFSGTLKCHGAYEIGPEALNKLWLGEKFERRCTKFCQKMKKVKKSIFDEIYLKIEGSIEINRTFSNKYFIAVTRRAGWLILGSKSNTV